MKIWEAWIRIPKDGHTKQVVTRVPATDVYTAILLLEKQYGKGCVMGPPREVKG